MAWNRPTGKTADTRTKRKTRSALVSGLAAGCVLVATLAVWMLVRENPRTEIVSAKAKVSVREPKPVKARKPETMPVATTKQARVEAKLTRKVALPPKIRHADLLPQMNRKYPHLFRDHDVFTCESDVIIADMLVARPGERLVDFDLGEGFDAKFAASLSTPIEDHELDTEDDKLLKKAVREARVALASLRDNGETVSKLVQETRDELNKIADYRDLLDAELHRMLKSSDETEIDQYVQEANRLLDEYSAPHLEFSDKRRAKVRMRTEQPQGTANE